MISMDLLVKKCSPGVVACSRRRVGATPRDQVIVAWTDSSTVAEHISRKLAPQSIGVDFVDRSKLGLLLFCVGRDDLAARVETQQQCCDKFSVAMFAGETIEFGCISCDFKFKDSSS